MKEQKLNFFLVLKFLLGFLYIAADSLFTLCVLTTFGLNFFFLIYPI